MADPKPFSFGATANPAPGFNFQLPTQTPAPVVPPPQVPQPQKTGAAAPIDIMQFFQALQGLYHPDPLGAVARGNSRPPGLTPQGQWDTMFTPTTPERQAQMTNHPQATAAQMSMAPGTYNPAQAGWAAGHSVPQGPQPAPVLPPVLPGTMQAEQVAGRYTPPAAPTNPFAHLFRLFGI